MLEGEIMNSTMRVIAGAKVQQEVPSYEESVRFQARLIGLWEQQQKILGYTPATIALNIRNINEILDVSDRFIWELTTSDMDVFYESMVNKGLAYSTRRKYQSGVTSFLEFLSKRHSADIYSRYGVNVPVVIDKFNRHMHRKDDIESYVLPPKPEILDRFWNGLKQQMQDARKYSTIARDYMVFRTMELSGLRGFECSMLDVKDLRFDLGEHGKIDVRYGKGSRGTGYKERLVPMLMGLDNLFKWYLKQVRPLYIDQADGPLFLSERGNRFTRDNIRGVVRRRQIELGFRAEELFSPHQLRHQFATHLTELGVDLLTLKNLLGHSKVQTTFEYVAPSDNYLEKRIRMAQDLWQKQLLNYEKGRNENGSGMETTKGNG
jgi:site-specific recombinase XerD